MRASKHSDPTRLKQASPQNPLSISTEAEFNHAVTNCRKCRRLIRHCETIGKTKRAAFLNQEYWAKPVPSFGNWSAHLWIVGLAPGAHGANRTGRMFTGDSSGDWLYRELFRVGLASSGESNSRQDGLTLKRTYISATARCAPPDNRPTPREISNCRPFLELEWDRLNQRRVILVLGRIAWEAIWKLIEPSMEKQKRPEFRHGAKLSLGKETVVQSYHPSRQNTNTGRLTRVMWSQIFDNVVESL